MGKAKNGESEFFRSLIHRPEIKHNRVVLDRIIEAAQSAEYIPALKAIADEREKELRKMHEEVAKIPFGETGEWMAFKEIVGMNLGYDAERLKTTLAPTTFQKHPKEGKAPEETKYWITAENVNLIDNNGRGSAWACIVTDYRSASAQQTRLMKVVGSLESKLTSSEQVQTENHGQIDLTGENMLSIPQMVEAGSKYSMGYLRQVLNKKKDLFKFKEHPKRGQLSFVYVTAENSHLVGLDKYFPQRQQNPAERIENKSAEGAIDPRIEMIEKGETRMPLSKIVSSSNLTNIRYVLNKNKIGR